MSHCYKCGCPLSSGVECDPPCSNEEAEPIISQEQAKKILAEYERNYALIDWDKVTTLEDVLLVLKTVFVEARIHRQSPAFEKLRKFLKEKNPHD